MAYDDSLPERRNLVVTSLAFIVFTTAGGDFKDNVVQLEVVNATFSRPTVLFVLAWMALFWFIYRYWLEHSGKLSMGLRTEISAYVRDTHLRNYASIKLNGRKILDKERGYFLHSIHWSNGALHGQCIAATEVTRNEDGGLAGWTPTDLESPFAISFSGIRGWTAVMVVLAKWAFQNQTFSSFAVPYLLSVIAICCGLYRLLF